MLLLYKSVQKMILIIHKSFLKNGISLKCKCLPLNHVPPCNQFCSLQHDDKSEDRFFYHAASFIPTSK
ncbi:hypothetical protein OIU84_026504 [Salix udensis]|uniref:Uncharacterized protein n=1 Tax=Salix udensis TaxID=889485 RepID=A0AAD6PES8_9ROSI|nr:hypothetical protein OIU84_026504 [Salix udensis]